ncbi:sigma-70 family RNA polymerase sigma factor [Piscinibacter sp.]|jgi:RNA polymerase sigma factor for flagellar operon FliA|uniref:sigma-70 family RNA polymerase sigma factor n=1 Tax=Piscinibacter sp. TaxID=1903157 RepID=UPI002F40C9CA
MDRRPRPLRPTQKEADTVIQTPATHPACERSARLLEHRPLVAQIARRLLGHLPSHVSMDELMQAGMVGLHEAMCRLDPEQGANIGTDASRRIERAMLDQLRATDTLPREVRAQQRQIRAAVHRLEQRLGRPPRAKEVADELGWTLAAFHCCMGTEGAGSLPAGNPPLEASQDESSTVDGADDFSADAHSDPLRYLQLRERLAALSRAFEELTDREQYVMEMIFERGLRLDEVGVTLGVTGARICQIQQRAIAKLRKRLASR